MNLFLLQAAAPEAAKGGLMGGSWGTIIMMVVLILIFWLFFIRPQSKRQKELQRKREAMTEGDKVITAGGIHGVRDRDCQRCTDPCRQIFCLRCRRRRRSSEVIAPYGVYSLEEGKTLAPRELLNRVLASVSLH